MEGAQNALGFGESEGLDERVVGARVVGAASSDLGLEEPGRHHVGGGPARQFVVENRTEQGSCPLELIGTEMKDRLEQCDVTGPSERFR